MPTVEETFGVNAGKVWNALNEKGPQTAAELRKTTKLTTNEVYGALGWLAREGKINILYEKRNKNPRYSLQ
jgi:hypothetical protein